MHLGVEPIFDEIEKGFVVLPHRKESFCGHVAVPFFEVQVERPIRLLCLCEYQLTRKGDFMETVFPLGIPEGHLVLNTNGAASWKHEHKQPLADVGRKPTFGLKVVRYLLRAQLVGFTRIDAITLQLEHVGSLVGHDCSTCISRGTATTLVYTHMKLLIPPHNHSSYRYINR